jgi:hypothetical protein
MPLMPFRLRFAFSHFACSALVVGTFVAWVLGFLYPPPLAQLEGVLLVLMLVVLVDLCLGPLLTLVVANPRKPRASLVRDVGAIVIVQIAALGYGAYSVYVSRPAFVVFNTDRFDIVTPSELVWQDSDRSGTPGISLPYFGPVWVQALPPSSLEERNRLLLATVLGGPDLKHLPHLFHTWPTDGAAAISRAKPVSELAKLSSEHRKAVDAAIKTAGLSDAETVYVPLLGREATGAVLLRRPDASIVAVLRVPPVY